MRQVEFGIFMPIASNGFIFSKRAPHYQPTFELHRQIALAAEGIGLDYLFWMGKWKGFGGPTHHWEQSLEPITLTSAIAASTKHLRLYATINPLIFHPTVAAKMVATIDDVSGGRFGINIVTGNTLDEYEQMGVVPEGYNQNRYAYADEWTTVIKELWTKDKVTFKGRFFDLIECVSDPKPRQKPYPTIVSAGSSAEGLRFGAKHSDYAFIGLRPEEIAQTRKFAAEYGRPIKIASNFFLLLRSTDAEAQKELTLLREELDHEALNNLIASTERDMRDKKRADYLRAPHVIGFGSGTPLAGSPETIARKLARIIEDSGVDALQFTFLDFVKDLEVFGREVAPLLKDLLRQQGVYTNAGKERATAA
ncbi:MAG TPA: LLM class flavin-dependent oxidoreductase [Stellaceae bacterium]|nr:LLM class flavin-dependent oxidoreductase [Stellaceae bacterium]